MPSTDHILTDDEKAALRAVVHRDGPLSVRVFGEGEHRTVSLYAEGTRLEARIAYPDGST